MMGLTDEQREQIEATLAAMEPEINGLIQERNIARSALPLDIRYPLGDHVHPTQIVQDAKIAAIAHCNAIIAILEA
jgi:hypothetical protein